MPVRYTDYVAKLVEHGIMKVLAIANVQETSQAWIRDTKFQVIKPDLVVKVSSCCLEVVHVVVKSSIRGCFDVV